VGLAVLLLAGSTSLLVTGLVGSQFFPNAARDQFVVDLYLPEGTPIRTALDVKIDVVTAYTTVLQLQQAVTVAEANVTSLANHARVVDNLLQQALAAKTISWPSRCR